MQRVIYNAHYELMILFSTSKYNTKGKALCLKMHLTKNTYILWNMNSWKQMTIYCVTVCVSSGVMAGCVNLTGSRITQETSLWNVWGVVQIRSTEGGRPMLMWVSQFQRLESGLRKRREGAKHVSSYVMFHFLTADVTWQGLSSWCHASPPWWNVPLQL